MKIKKIVLIFVIVCSSTYAQSIKGKITYLTTLNSDEYIENLKTDSTISEDRKEELIQRSLAAKPINYILVFNETESLYSSEIDLPTLRKQGIGMNMTRSVSEHHFVSYTNSKTKENSRKSFWIDKTVIDIEPLEWILTNEEKTIGAYKCLKATAILNEENETGEIVNCPITAWYTHEIPVSFGVQNFVGLPGLTLELSIRKKRGSLLYKAIEIELNPEEIIDIEKPEGKHITHKEYIKYISGDRLW